MTSEPICWMIIATCSAAELERFAEADYAREFPHAVHNSPWRVASGTAHAAVISRLAGSEGGDWALGERLSRQIGRDPVYTLWFDPERSVIVEWRDGRRIADRSEDPEQFARSLGFDLEDDAGTSWDPPANRNVTVVEATTVEALRGVLGARADESWLRIEQGPIGAILTADDGDLGTESWDVSDALPNATVYHVQHELDSDVFTVLVLRNGEVTESLRRPALDGATDLHDIKGAHTPQQVLAVLGIAPALLGY